MKDFSKMGFVFPVCIRFILVYLVTSISGSRSLCDEPSILDELPGTWRVEEVLVGDTRIRTISKEEATERYLYNKYQIINIKNSVYEIDDVPAKLVEHTIFDENHALYEFLVNVGLHSDRKMYFLRFHVDKILFSRFIFDGESVYLFHDEVLLRLERYED